MFDAASYIQINLMAWTSKVWNLISLGERRKLVISNPGWVQLASKVSFQMRGFKKPQRCILDYSLPLARSIFSWNLLWNFYERFLYDQKSAHSFIIKPVIVWMKSCNESENYSSCGHLIATASYCSLRLRLRAIWIDQKLRKIMNPKRVYL